METIKGDILNIKEGVIAQQVNCKAVMGAGLARQIKEKYPIVFNEYINFCKRVPEKNRLGLCQIISINNNLHFANLFGQFNFGSKKFRYTDYEALSAGVRNLNVWCEKYKFQIYYPYKIGCGLAGGDWRIVYDLLDTITPQAKVVKKEN